MQNTDPALLRGSIRREILKQRDALSDSQRQIKSASICERVFAEPLISMAETIFTYINFRSEVETMEMVTQWLAAKKTVCVPLTVEAESRLDAYQIKDPEKDLSPGYWQIPEPDPRTATHIDPADIEVIMLPGSAFDLNGGRLGYGGGFYDRFISSQAPNALRVGLAFDVQITDRLPLLPHDQSLNLLITESRTIHFN